MNIEDYINDIEDDIRKIFNNINDKEISKEEKIQIVGKTLASKYAKNGMLKLTPELISKCFDKLKEIDGLFAYERSIEYNDYYVQADRDEIDKNINLEFKKLNLVRQELALEIVSQTVPDLKLTPEMVDIVTGSKTGIKSILSNDILVKYANDMRVVSDAIFEDLYSKGFQGGFKDPAVDLAYKMLSETKAIQNENKQLEYTKDILENFLVQDNKIVNDLINTAQKQNNDIQSYKSNISTMNGTNNQILSNNAALKDYKVKKKSNIFSKIKNLFSKKSTYLPESSIENAIDANVYDMFNTNNVCIKKINDLENSENNKILGENLVSRSSIIGELNRVNNVVDKSTRDKQFFEYLKNNGINYKLSQNQINMLYNFYCKMSDEENIKNNLQQKNDSMYNLIECNKNIIQNLEEYNGKYMEITNLMNTSCNKFESNINNISSYTRGLEYDNNKSIWSKINSDNVETDILNQNITLGSYAISNLKINSYHNKCNYDDLNKFRQNEIDRMDKIIKLGPSKTSFYYVFNKQTPNKDLNQKNDEGR